jgi:DNA-binding MarR family transcriptional regulator
MIHPGESPGFMLWHATLRWQRRISQALAPMGLTHVQFVLLACTWWLNQQDQHPSQVELATFAGTDVKMTSQVLRSLERKGLLGREVDPVDTRARLLRVTRPGARLAPRAIAVVQQVDAEFFDEVPADALHLLRALARITPGGGRPPFNEDRRPIGSRVSKHSRPSVRDTDSAEVVGRSVRTTDWEDR